MATAALPLISAGISGLGSLFGGLFGGSASSKASQQYIQGLQQAQSELQKQEQQGEENYSPFLQAGQGAATTLSSLLGTPGKGLLTPWTQQFTAPTAAQAAATPGYQFQLQQGTKAMQNSAAGQGGLLSGRTLADLNNYAQGAASTNYQNTFNNAQAQYQSAYNTFLNNQNSQYSMLSGLSGQGLQAAGGDSQLLSGLGGDIASLYGQQGAAKAQGTIGTANAYGSMIPGLTSAGTTLLSSLNPISSLATFNGGSVGNYSDPALGTPQYMPNSNPYSGTNPVAPNVPLGSAAPVNTSFLSMLQ
jgi:hypothetical protein